MDERDVASCAGNRVPLPRSTRARLFWGQAAYAKQLWCNLRALPLGGGAAQDYVFEEGARELDNEDDVSRVRLSELSARDAALSVFVRRDGKVYYFYNSELLFAPVEPGTHPRHVDLLWPRWNVFDLTPEGRGKD